MAHKAFAVKHGDIRAVFFRRCVGVVEFKVAVARVVKSRKVPTGVGGEVGVALGCYLGDIS